MSELASLLSRWRLAAEKAESARTAEKHALSQVLECMLQDAHLPYRVASVGYSDETGWRIFLAPGQTDPSPRLGSDADTPSVDAAAVSEAAVIPAESVKAPATPARAPSAPAHPTPAALPIPVMEERHTAPQTAANAAPVAPLFTPNVSAVRSGPLVGAEDLLDDDLSFPVPLPPPVVPRMKDAPLVAPSGPREEPASDVQGALPQIVVPIPPRPVAPSPAARTPDMESVTRKAPEPISSPPARAAESPAAPVQPAAPAASSVVAPRPLAEIFASLDAGARVPDTEVREDRFSAPRSPVSRATLHARTLVGDIVAYRLDERDRALADGPESLRTRFADSIETARGEFRRQVAEADVPNAEELFVEALNEILCRGQKVF